MSHFSRANNRIYPDRRTGLQGHAGAVQGSCDFVHVADHHLGALIGFLANAEIYRRLSDLKDQKNPAREAINSRLKAQ